MPHKILGTDNSIQQHKQRHHNQPASFKKDYFVPSFGADPDIDASLNHSKDLTLPAETVDKDGEDVFPYQDEKFKVESHYKFVPI